jgi:hypothetical protein
MVMYDLLRRMEFALQKIMSQKLFLQSEIDMIIIFSLCMWCTKINSFLPIGFQWLSWASCAPHEEALPVPLSRRYEDSLHCFYNTEKAPVEAWPLSIRKLVTLEENPSQQGIRVDVLMLQDLYPL